MDTLPKPLTNLLDQLKVDNDLSVAFKTEASEKYSVDDCPQYHMLWATGNDLELGACFETRGIRVTDVIGRHTEGQSTVYLRLEVRLTGS